jgi:hypothetical protein
MTNSNPTSTPTANDELWWRMMRCLNPCSGALMMSAPVHAYVWRALLRSGLAQLPEGRRDDTGHPRLVAHFIERADRDAAERF